MSVTSSPIYLDYMATTPVDTVVSDVMREYEGLSGVFANPASVHVLGQQAALQVADARASIAAAIHAEASEIIFTSGATEANNLALKGAAVSYQRQGKHIITCQTEHKAVLDCLRYLEQQGFDVTYLPVLPSGLLDLAELTKALRPETSLVSIMLVNNEIGVIQDIKAIAKLCHANGSLLHVDAAQAVGKIAVNVRDLDVDLMSFTAHKLYGPKGIGALYRRAKPKVQLQAQIHGGGQEMGLRSGTLAVPLIMGFAKAVSLAVALQVAESARLLSLRQRLWQGIADLPGIQLNGDEQQRVAGNLNVSFKGLNGEALLYALHELAIAQGSACSSAQVTPSHVLTALGLPAQLALSSLRISLGRYTTAEDIERTISIIRHQVTRLQRIGGRI